MLDTHKKDTICVVCGEPICTLSFDECECEEKGCELDSGFWVCGEQCWETFFPDKEYYW